MSFRLFVIASWMALTAGCALFEGHEVCQVCRRPLHSETFYRVTLEDGTVRQVCCPRCGLHFQAGRTDVASAQTTDYSSGELIAAEEAVYVENSSVMLCCKLDKLTRDRSGGRYELEWDRCLPSLVSFRERGDAVRFQQEHGGTLATFAALKKEPDFAQPLIHAHEP